MIQLSARIMVLGSCLRILLRVKDVKMDKSSETSPLEENKMAFNDVTVSRDLIRMLPGISNCLKLVETFDF